MNAYATLEDLPPRFWAKVDRTGSCWIWTGANVRGYGQFQVEGKRVYVHRLTYSLANDVTIPAGLQIDHLCRVPSCCNPEHLEMVTGRENVMRSNAFGAVNARKTHCPQGHAYTPDNTYISPKAGARSCRTCKVARQRASTRRHGKQVAA